MKQTEEQNQFRLDTPKLSTGMGNFKFSPIDIQQPFSIKFSHKEEYITVQLENAEDILKLAQIFSNMLSNNNIPNKIIKE